MSAVLKTSLIGGVLMAVFYILAIKYHFPFFPIKIVIIPGGMMFTINGFLKPVSNRKHYSYIIGVLLGVLYTILAIALCVLIIEIYDFGFYFRDPFRIIRQAGIFVGRNLFLIIISALLIPMMYWKQSSDTEQGVTDILDEGL